MDLSTILLGAVIALFIVLMKTEHKQQHAPSTTRVISAPPPTPPPRSTPLSWPTPIRTTPIQQSWPTQITEERVSTRGLVETWKNSIAGLVRLAQTNLRAANQYLEAGNYQAAMQHALTSAENISRALLHCYGEKPEQSSGQEEVLRLLAMRLRAKAPADYEKALEEFAHLEANGVPLRCQAEGRQDVSLSPTKVRAEQVITSTAKVVSLFSHIIDEHFATEIPDLPEVCPKCHTMDPAVMTFNETYATYTCTQCKHSWSQPRI